MSDGICPNCGTDFGEPMPHRGLGGPCETFTPAPASAQGERCVYPFRYNGPCGERKDSILHRHKPRRCKTTEHEPSEGCHPFTPATASAATSEAATDDPIVKPWNVKRSELERLVAEDDAARGRDGYFTAVPVFVPPSPPAANAELEEWTLHEHQAVREGLADCGGYHVASTGCCAASWGNNNIWEPIEVMRVSEHLAALEAEREKKSSALRVANEEIQKLAAAEKRADASERAMDNLARKLTDAEKRAELDRIAADEGQKAAKILSDRLQDRAREIVQLESALAALRARVEELEAAGRKLLANVQGWVHEEACGIGVHIGLCNELRAALAPATEEKGKGRE